MVDTLNHPSTIIRTERGLSIAEPRYALRCSGLLTRNWPPALIQSWLNLSDTRMANTLDYIEKHRAEVEQEYQQVIRQASEIRDYWEFQNRDRLARPRSTPSVPTQTSLKAKLQAWKAKIKQE